MIKPLMLALGLAALGWAAVARMGRRRHLQRRRLERRQHLLAVHRWEAEGGQLPTHR